MKWLLIVITHVYFGSVAQPISKFPTQNECEAAGKQISTEASRVANNGTATFLCIQEPKP